MNFLEFDPSVVCLSLSLIDSLHGLFFTTFLFHFFILLRPFGQQHANAEHFVRSSVSDLCTQATSIFYLRSDLSIHYCQLHSTFLYDLSFWRSYSALVSLHTGLRYVLYLQIIIKKIPWAHAFGFPTPSCTSKDNSLCIFLLFSWCDNLCALSSLFLAPSILQQQSERERTVQSQPNK